MLRALFSLEAVYVASGATLALFALFTARDRGNPARRGTALFWLLLGVLFAFGGVLPAWLAGALVVALVALDALGLVRRGAYHEAPPAERERAAARHGNALLVPVLMIPALTFAATALLRGRRGVDANTLLYVSMGAASVLAAGAALAITRARPAALVHEGRRLADAIGAAVILPQLLASLGELFRVAGVGAVIARKVSAVIPAGSPFAVVLILCASMSAFSFVMGNSFAAFPVIMSGIGIPLLVVPYRADPALVGAVAITVASCGTLCTPMAANFNMVPPALFEMKDRYGMIRFQAPFAAAIFVAHVAVLWLGLHVVAAPR